MMNSLLSSILLVPMFLILVTFIIITKGQADMVENFGNKVETESKLDNFVYNWDDSFTESKVPVAIFVFYR